MWGPRVSWFPNPPSEGFKRPSVDGGIFGNVVNCFRDKNVLKLVRFKMLVCEIAFVLLELSGPRNFKETNAPLDVYGLKVYFRLDRLQILPSEFQPNSLWNIFCCSDFRLKIHISEPTRILIMHIFRADSHSDNAYCSTQPAPPRQLSSEFILAKKWA